MRQVSSVGKVESEEFVARFQCGHEDRHIGLCSGVRLHIGIFGTEYLLDTFDGELFGTIHNLTSAVVAVSGIAFGVLVGEA